MLLPFNFKYIIKRYYSCVRYSLLKEGCMGLPCTFLCLPSVKLLNFFKIRCFLKRELHFIVLRWLYTVINY